MPIRTATFNFKDNNFVVVKFDDQTWWRLRNVGEAYTESGYFAGVSDEQLKKITGIEDVKSLTKNQSELHLSKTPGKKDKYISEIALCQVLLKIFRNGMPDLSDLIKNAELALESDEASEIDPTHNILQRIEALEREVWKTPQEINNG